MTHPDELRRSLAALRTTLASVPDPIILVDGQGLVREANGAACALFPTLRVGRPISYGVRGPELLRAVADAPARGIPEEVEYRERVPLDRAFAVRVAAITASGDDKSADVSVMLFFRDLTQARRLERMRVDFVANVSHELRTPLASVLGFIETLQGPARDDPAARERFLEIMRVQAWRMTRLIDDLLSLSRIELREHVAPSTRVDLGLVAAQIIATLSTMAQRDGIDIALAAPEGPAFVLGDADELSRVVENLIENAVKYGGSGKRVDVVVVDRNGEVELSVRDYGRGIAREHVPRLTERFYRADVAESREKGGTGLGLAIVKHIVNRHRGRLSIESEPGQGALFRVVLAAAH